MPAARSSAVPEQSASRQPRLWQAPGHSGPSASTTTCPSSAAEAVRAAEDAAAGHDAAAHARPEREHHELARVDRVGLGERRAAGVVVHVDGDPEPAAELGAQRDVRQRDVHARNDGAGRPLDLRRHADADRIGLARLRGHLADRGLDALEQRRGGLERRRILDGVASVVALDGRRRDLRSSYVDADEAGHSAAFWYKSQPMDRRLAYKNMRTALIAGAIALIIFALSFVSGLVYT